MDESNGYNDGESLPNQTIDSTESSHNEQEFLSVDGPVMIQNRSKDLFETEIDPPIRAEPSTFNNYSNNEQVVHEFDQEPESPIQDDNIVHVTSLPLDTKIDMSPEPLTIPYPVQDQTIAENSDESQHQQNDYSLVKTPVTAKSEKHKLVTLRENGIIMKVLKNRQVYLINEQDSDLFDEIYEFHNKDNPLASFKKYCSQKNGEALVKSVDGSYQYDYIIQYSLSSKDPEKHEYRTKIRIEFEKLLLKNGLILEHENSPDGESAYIKVIAPFHRLCDEAQEQKISFELEEQDVDSNQKGAVGKSMNSLGKASDLIDFFLNQSVEKVRPPQAPFKVKKLKHFKGGNIEKYGEYVVQSEFFSNAQRILLTYWLISEVRLPSFKKKRNVTIRYLIKEKVFKEMFPLHDGTFKKNGTSMNLRAQLNRQWVSKFFSYQPIDQIRSYLGEKTSIYFSWLGFYTSWLGAVALLGFVVFVYGLTKADDQQAGAEVLVRIFDNELSPFFALFMAVWATLYLEYWKRYQSSLAYKWDTWKFEKTEVLRPEWKPTTARKSPITGKYELHQPTWLYRTKLGISTAITLTCIAIVVISVGAVIVYRVFINFALGTNSTFSWVAPVTSGLMSLLVLIILGSLYRYIAVILTDWENHKYQTEYEDALISKQFLFDFVNTYSTLFYIGLIKEPAGKNILGRQGWNDTCTYSSCLADLMIQLTIIFIGQRIIAQMQAYLIPVLTKKWNQREEEKKLKETRDKFIMMYGVKLEEDPLMMEEFDPKEIPIWCKDDLLPPPKDLNDQYKEMCLQYGFTTLFITAFPLAPLFAYLNNLIEIRQDAFSFIVASKRAVPFRAQDIGKWYSILTVVSYIAVLTNACLIAFSSKNFEQTWLIKIGPAGSNEQMIGKILFVFLFEHLVFGLKAIVQYLIPDVPPIVKRAILREDYLARVTLEGEPRAQDDPEALEMLGLSNETHQIEQTSNYN